MKKIIIFCTLVISNLISEPIIYKQGCKVPHILVETVKLTENEKEYPYYIRTNESTKYLIFNEIVERFTYRKTSDKNLIDCINKDNCTYIANTLIENNVKNIDLGLFQINYSFYPSENVSNYFNENSYFEACRVIEHKQKIAKTWSWKVLADYHSTTQSLNDEYQKRLIANYFKLLRKEQLLISYSNN